MSLLHWDVSKFSFPASSRICPWGFPSGTCQYPCRAWGAGDFARLRLWIASFSWPEEARPAVIQEARDPCSSEEDLLESKTYPCDFIKSGVWSTERWNSARHGTENPQVPRDKDGNHEHLQCPLQDTSCFGPQSGAERWEENGDRAWVWRASATLIYIHTPVGSRHRFKHVRNGLMKFKLPHTSVPFHL